MMTEVEVLDATPFVVITIDPEGTILYVNRAAARGMGRAPEELVGTSLFAQFPAHATAMRERVRRTISTRQQQDMESLMPLADGRRPLFQARHCPILDADGRVTAVQIIAWEASPRRAGDADDGMWAVVTDELSMTHRRVHALLENAAMVISVYDPDMSIRYLNRVLEGRALSDAIGQRPLAWLVERDRPVFQAAFERVLVDRAVTECEVEGVSERHWFLRLAPLIHDGAVRQVLGCAIDVTERKRLEQQLARREKLASLGTMARGVAHDFNNLLTVVLGNVGLGRLRARSGGDVQAVFEDIELAARRAAELCEAMMTYGATAEPVAELGELNQVIEELLPLSRVRTRAGLELRCGLAPDLPMVACNRVPLGQIVLNLVNNAADALGDGAGTISVSSELVGLGEVSGDFLPETPAPGPYVRFRVADTGPGLTAADRLRIFDPFFSTKPDGHGLGLPVVLGIVSSHHGAISVESAPGVGTVMTVLLPARDRAAVAAARQAAPRREGTVLVVDDEAAVRAMLRSLLHEAGYRVIDVDSGDAALAHLHAEAAAIDLVILDVNMPERDGYGTLRELRRRHRDLPVLLSSGRQVSLPEGDPFAGSLPKPYIPEILLEVVAARIASRAASAAAPSP
ncbi:MAG: PAS domain-containing protein [Kofleriaceae bacterium]|nr:PAS domain-containing protein [Myxococcales bacterium]MCB9562213.1 PAS domain-containing protein [Kofleriaceae bacterium]